MAGVMTFLTHARRFVVSSTAWLALVAAVGPLGAQEAEWIWSNDHTKEAVPKDAKCHFRRTFTMKNPEAGSITIAADDTYELYVNGRRIGTGAGVRKLVEYDVTAALVRGPNLVAVRVVNKTGNTAALCARVTVKEKGSGWQSHSTAKNWKTNSNVLPLWNSLSYNDRGWETAQSFGKLGATSPWDLAENENPKTMENTNRFTIDKEFEVEKVLEGEVTGSAIAMSFNEFGQLLVSQESGPLQLIVDTNEDQVPDSARPFCDQVKSVQGILCLNGDVYVTAEGPEGPGLYRLTDKDRDGKVEVIKRLIAFDSPMGEHGAHGLTLGPDGLIYVVLGNLIKTVGDIDEASPYQNYYEGDLNLPRYEDPGGHAVGVKAPGGTVIRTDTEGSAVQVFAGGLRNAYDLTFNAEGELFIPDSDMESDEGAPWYRPTRVNHIVSGGEYGWRSGWANWPDYYVDQLPPIINTGRGSPTGVTCYNHHMFPQRYQGALFVADWSEGRILAVTLKPSGGSYTAETNVFLSGNPLNVTDLEIGPDGNLYFITGGRGTAGGLYRVSWKGQVPEGYRKLGEGISSVIRQPQIQSAYARQNAAVVKKQLGDKWGPQLLGVAASGANPPNYRLRALDLMQLYGPTPSEEFLTHLTKDGNERLRARATDLLGQYPTPSAKKRLVAMLQDGDRLVRRKACEAILRGGMEISFDEIEESLASDDRYTAWAARRLLEKMPLDAWSVEALETKNERVLVQSALAMCIAHPERENGAAAIEALRSAINKFVTDRDFIDILRAMQVAILRGELKPEELTGLREQLREEFPAGDSAINRELIRLLTYLQETSILDRYIAYLKSDAPEADRALVGLNLRYLKDNWTPEQRLQVLEFYESAQRFKAGNAFTRYVINVTRDFAMNLTEEESLLVLKQGAQWPNAALGALYKLPPKLDEELFDTLQQLDGKLDDADESAQRLKIGIVAVMTRSGDERSLAYLRQVWQIDPERRQAVAMGLSMHRQSENWDYLVLSLPILDPAAAVPILDTLKQMDDAPEEASPYRHVILLGLKLKEKGADSAIGVLEHWSGEQLAADESWEKKLAAWQKWYAKTYPDAPPAELPTVSGQAKWTYEHLQEFLLKNEEYKGDSMRGSLVYVKAQCAKCHRSGTKGEGGGPDLTAVSKRFMKKEILEAIYYPSHVISDQYAAKTVTTVGGKSYTGIVTAGGASEVVVLQSSGERITLRKNDIEETVPSKLSAMPEGLLDPLTQEEISDLFAYLVKPHDTPVAERTKPRTLRRK